MSDRRPDDEHRNPPGHTERGDTGVSAQAHVPDNKSLEDNVNKAYAEGMDAAGMRMALKLLDLEDKGQSRSAGESPTSGGFAARELARNPHAGQGRESAVERLLAERRQPETPDRGKS